MKEMEVRDKVFAMPRAYKYKTLDTKKITETMTSPNYLLKIIPHIDCITRICELVEYYLTNINVKGAWTGHTQPELAQQALTPVASLPVRRVVSALNYNQI